MAKEWILNSAMNRFQLVVDRAFDGYVTEIKISIRRKAATPLRFVLRPGNWIMGSGLRTGQILPQAEITGDLSLDEHHTR
jgi:hypothetical protein